MKTFKAFVAEEVASSKRKSMVHFEDLKDLDFVKFVTKIHSEMSGKLKDVFIQLKVDGTGARFGKDKTGRAFFESSHSGPIFNAKEFSKFAISRQSSDDTILRARHFDDMFDVITQSSLIKKLPNDTKISCEILYYPMADLTDQGIVFTHIAYDVSKVGSLMTIIPFNVTIASSGLPHPDSDNLIKQLISQSTNEIKIIDPVLSIKGDIDLTAFIDPILSLNQRALDVLNSRKNADKEAKDNYKQIIKTVKQDIANYILNHQNIVGKYIIGDTIEGLVLEINGQLVKITTPHFRRLVADSRAKRANNSN